MTQTRQILSYMQRGRSIDPLVSLRLFGCFRLAARILEIKEYGHRVKREMVRNRAGRKFARYYLSP